MDNKESVLLPKADVGRSVLLPHIKGTAETESVKMPPAASVVLPMRMHIGAPCEPTVKVGDKVFVGTKIGDSDKPVSAPIHSSVSGTVKAICKYPMPDGSECDAIEIESDGEMKVDPEIKPPQIINKERLLEATRNCGLVGLGGAGFPTHIKFRLPEETKIDTLIINGAECEPYITADYRCCLEDFRDIFRGVYLVKEYLNIDRVIIAIEGNKRDAIKKLYEIAADERDIDDNVKLMELKTNYPQGAEKVIIYSALGRIIPAGKLPADIGCMVMNITSIAELGHFARTGIPLVSRRVTVDGAAVAEPKNVIVPLGTKVSDLIEFCGGYTVPPTKLVMGGPMMGSTVLNDNVVITKTSNAVLALTDSEVPHPTGCIHCGRCAAHCPMKLNPADVERALSANNVEKLSSLYVNYCMECGCCAFSCPARRPLAQVMRVAKQTLRRNTAK